MAIVLFVISHFLPAYSNIPGYSCFQECWEIMMDHDLGNLGGWLYYSGFVLSNIAFLLLSIGLFVTRKARSFRLLVSLMMVLHTISWFCLHIGRDISEIELGYYIWLTAYVLLFEAYLTTSPGGSLAQTAGTAVA